MFYQLLNVWIVLGVFVSNVTIITREDFREEVARKATIEVIRESARAVIREAAIAVIREATSAFIREYAREVIRGDSREVDRGDFREVIRGDPAGRSSSFAREEVTFLRGRFHFLLPLQTHYASICYR